MDAKMAHQLNLLRKAFVALFTSKKIHLCMRANMPI